MRALGVPFKADVFTVGTGITDYLKHGNAVLFSSILISSRKDVFNGADL
jgi:hypothetical protein